MDTQKNTENTTGSRNANPKEILGVTRMDKMRNGIIGKNLEVESVNH